MRSITETSTITVSDYASRIGRAVRHVGGAVLEGEVQKPNRSRGGLLYFDLTDGDSTLCCKVFGRQIGLLQHAPKEGDLVQVTVERPDFWTARGKLDLIIADVELAGIGVLLRRRAELLASLTAEGLCDTGRRKPLPQFPRAVGLIAGRGSDARSDVIRALEDRFPPVHIVICDALVQGKAAPRDLIDALACLQEHPLVDVIVMGRGGGSVQDLIAFDDERLCRAIFASDVPVVTAIGHTDNIPVCNHITHAAYTPSRSAEMVVPSVVELRQDLSLAMQVLEGVPVRLERKTEQLDAADRCIRVPELIEEHEREVAGLSQRIASMRHAFFSSQESLLADARATVNTMPHRARAAISECERRLGLVRPRLVTGGHRIEMVASDVAEQGRRLGVGIARQLSDHERDYSRALARLIKETRGAILRRVGSERDRVDDVGGRTRERVGRQLADVGRELAHVTALIEARDVRRRGFVLATDEAGRAVTSVSCLRRGWRLNLKFHDGDARAVVDHINEENP
jgi:exodeoxyribonuclease VII large subunit